MVSNEPIGGSHTQAPVSGWVHAGLWLCGTLLGMVAYLAADSLDIRSPLTWSVALLLGIVTLPISAAVHLTFWLWADFSFGHWIVIALTAGLYHGTVAVVLGLIYRRKPSDAVAIGGAILALHLILYFLWQAIRPAVSG